MATSFSVAQLVAKTVLAELAVRRGDADATERLADLAAQAARASEPQRLAPLVELEIEWSLTTGADLPIERLELLLDQARPPGPLIGWGATRVAAMGGRLRDLEPSSTHRDRSRTSDASGGLAWRGRRLRRNGWSYDRALMLSLLDDEQVARRGARDRPRCSAPSR